MVDFYCSHAIFIVTTVGINFRGGNSTVTMVCAYVADQWSILRTNIINGGEATFM